MLITMTILAMFFPTKVGFHCNVRMKKAVIWLFSNENKISYENTMHIEYNIFVSHLYRKKINTQTKYKLLNYVSRT